jgi:peptide/nickel transport system permease protein
MASNNIGSISDITSPSLRRATFPRIPRLPLNIAFTCGLLLAVFICLLSPLVYPTPAPVGGDVLDANQPLFSAGHPLGTDMIGNDVWSRLIHGGRTSILIALVVNVIGLLAGGALGVTAGYLGGITDGVIMRILDVLLAFPSLILILAVAQALGPGTLNTIWALAFFTVPAFARLARATTLSVREQPFVLVARLSGTSTMRVLGLHITPNVFPQLAIFSLLGMGVTITIEGAVSFLGLGVPLPQPSWGNMIYQGQLSLSATPALVLLPSLFLFVTVLAFNLLGEALRARAASR